MNGPSTWPHPAVVGAVAAGLVGAVVGLVIGLRTYAPTAWFAAIEIGVPAAIVGAGAGLLVGLLSRRSLFSVDHGDPALRRLHQ